MSRFVKALSFFFNEIYIRIKILIFKLNRKNILLK